MLPPTDFSSYHRSSHTELYEFSMYLYFHKTWVRNNVHSIWYLTDESTDIQQTFNRMYWINIKFLPTVIIFSNRGRGNSYFVEPVIKYTQKCIHPSIFKLEISWYLYLKNGIIPYILSCTCFPPPTPLLSNTSWALLGGKIKWRLWLETP